MIFEVGNTEEIQLYEASGGKFSNSLPNIENTGFPCNIKRNDFFVWNHERYFKPMIYYRK